MSKELNRKKELIRIINDCKRVKSDDPLLQGSIESLETLAEFCQLSGDEMWDAISFTGCELTITLPSRSTTGAHTSN